jgi:hypothetical protein
MFTTMVITKATITPNPVNAGKQFVLSVNVLDKVFAIVDDQGRAILTDEGKAIEHTTETAILSSDNLVIMSDSGEAICIEK